MHEAIMVRSRRRRYFREILARLKRLLNQPVFWLVTFLGNGLVLLGAVSFYWAEAKVNPALQSFIDSLFWAVSTVTTVGYGSVVPVTFAGKVIGIGLMIFGTLFLWSYMALFVGAIISPDLTKLETEIRGLEEDLSQLQKLTEETRGEAKS